MSAGMSASASSPAIVWFRDDLRVADNPALCRAAASGRALICVYVHEGDGAIGRPLGGAARWMLHGALGALDAQLRRRGGALLLSRGAAGPAIEALAATTSAGAVFWNRRYGGPEREADATLKASLAARGVAAHSANASLMREPWSVANADGKPFRVFSAFWRAFARQGEVDPPEPAPERLAFHELPPAALSLAELRLTPRKPDWSAGLAEAWPAGEAAAHGRLGAFLEGPLRGYGKGRDRPDRAGTSRLSPYLRCGAISPRQAWAAAASAQHAGGGAGAGDFDKFRAELGWREFSYHLLYHFPELARRNFQPRFDAMAWRGDASGLEAWRRGRTGYPLVDAGMRELWATGWMHNRVRMVVASFLIKHLLVDWRQGEVWFWDTLVDADPASNAASWQWVAGSGADAAPYYRIFNPVLQGEKFDPDATYVKRWVPELAGLPPHLAHRPWTATPAELAAAGLRLGEDYPLPIVDHALARQRALAAHAALRGEAQG